MPRFPHPVGLHASGLARLLREMRRRQGVRGAAIYVPWILDGAAPDGQRRFLAALPAPVRVISGLLWEPRYRQRGLWKA